MTITFRHYQPLEDYQSVDDFLICHYQPDNRDGNWVEPAWEYMHFHSLLDSDSLGKIGIWDESGQIVAVALYEGGLGDAFFQFHPGYRHLRDEMIDYAEQNLWGQSKKDNRKYLCAFINDNDIAFQTLVKARGCEKKSQSNRPLAKFAIPNPFPKIELPREFRLTSLADDCDWAKVHRVMWRGFNHEGEPPVGEEELESRRRMFNTPSVSRFKNRGGCAAGGFCGFLRHLLRTNRYAYVEPVATDPDYRRLGLGRAAVLEGIRRCGELGATVAYVGSNLDFYLSIGFEVFHTDECLRIDFLLGWIMVLNPSRFPWASFPEWFFPTLY